MTQNQPRKPTPERLAQIGRLIVCMQRGEITIRVLNGGIIAIEQAHMLDIAHLDDAPGT